MPLHGESATVVALGKQSNSLKPTAGSFSFGTASRDQHSQVFLTKLHEKRKTSQCSPGPVYTIATSVGASTPRYGFGTAQKLPAPLLACGEASLDVSGTYPDAQVLKFHRSQNAVFGYELRNQSKNAAILLVNPQASAGLVSPGPAAYAPKDACVAKSSPHMTFTKSSWGKDTIGQTTSTPRHVGPGSYGCHSTMGKEPTSARKSAHSFSFSKSLRPGQQVRTSLLEGEPMEERTTELSSMGKQILSRGKSSAKYGFGTATRDHQDKLLLLQLKQDKGRFAGPSPRIPHPVIALERERIRYS